MSTIANLPGFETLPELKPCEIKTDIANSPKANAKAHWDFIHDLLVAANVQPEQLPLAEFLYRSAFEHGWKHAIAAVSAPKVQASVRTAA